MAEKKLRYSQQREAVYNYLRSTCEHPSAEMVYDALKGEMPALSLATVYRNLKLLEELGLVRRVTSYAGSERYDACCGDHIHFLCRGCGRVEDVKSADAEGIRAAVTLPAGCTADKMDLTVTGLCSICSTKTCS
ncbi:MAG: transcriptional repressor [Oscillospiraceae bacterium]|nr:transcriptional repressor [Oscillospiraceae bacterium]MBQ9960099.1 transcriptional repressor [Oscillospiraceae bacterium]